MQEYEALGVHAGQAVGLFFAAQYIDPKAGSQIINKTQQQFIVDYTNHFTATPLFLESYLGADQVLLYLALNEMRDSSFQDDENLNKLNRVQGIVQIYDYQKNPETGTVNMVVYKIYGSHIEEAKT